ncbi:RidA family protein, partial [Aeromonas caviae]
SKQESGIKRRSSHFSCVNTVPVNTYIYTKYFPAYLPARTVIGVSELPAGALVQMDAVMSNAESTPPQM